MNTVETLLRRNEAYIANRFVPGLRMMPALRTTIIGCVDPRVDPGLIFGLESGDAAVIRNVGGRVFPSTFQTMGMLRTVAKENGGEMGEGWNLIVLHHTDCGIRCLGHSPELLAKHFGTETAALKEMAIHDPYESVVMDVAALKTNPNRIVGVTVTGMVFDVATGQIRIVVPPEAFTAA